MFVHCWISFRNRRQVIHNLRWKCKRGFGFRFGYWVKCTQHSLKQRVFLFLKKDALSLIFFFWLIINKGNVWIKSMSSHLNPCGMTVFLSIEHFLFFISCIRSAKAFSFPIVFFPFIYLFLNFAIIRNVLSSTGQDYI